MPFTMGITGGVRVKRCPTHPAHPAPIATHPPAFHPRAPPLPAFPTLPSPYRRLRTLGLLPGGGGVYHLTPPPLPLFCCALRALLPLVAGWRVLCVRRPLAAYSDCQFYFSLRAWLRAGGRAHAGRERATVARALFAVATVRCSPRRFPSFNG